MQNLIYQIENSGLSVEAIAKRSGILPDRISAIVQGTIEPNMTDVRKLAKALRLSPDFLVSNNEKYQEVNVLFRQAITNDSDKAKADRISYVVGNTFSLLHNYRSNDRLFNSFPAVDNTYLNARHLAAMFRTEFWNGDFLSPMIGLPKLISEELNCILFVLELGKDVDGASAIINSIPFILISPRFGPRMLFTLAHELGHIIAHHNKDVNFAKFDKHISTLSRNSFKDEGFANAFASELLLPEEGVATTLQIIRDRLKLPKDTFGELEILYLSRIYGVSFEVAAMRCENLKFISSGSASALYKALCDAYGSPEQRAEMLKLPERPKMEFPKVSPSLIQSAIAQINSGDMSLGKAAELLSISVSDIVNYNSMD